MKRLFIAIFFSILVAPCANARFYHGPYHPGHSFYIHKGIWFAKGAPYYGPGRNQYWCAQNPDACHHWCKNHRSKCTIDGNIAYIIHP